MSQPSFGIVFDCDGTLVESLGPSLESFAYALLEVTGRKYEFPEITRYFGSSADKIFLSILKDQEQAERAFSIYLDHQTEVATRVRLHTGIRELLLHLRKKNIPMAVVTGRHARDLEIILKPHKIADSFITMITDSELLRSKPEPDGLVLAAKRLHLETNKIVYIGDSPMDILAAHRAGAKSIAALWDALTVRERMLAEKPTAVADHPADIEKIYPKLWI